jgi:hypothetical protein
MEIKIIIIEAFDHEFSIYIQSESPSKDNGKNIITLLPEFVFIEINKKTASKIYVNLSFF